MSKNKEGGNVMTKNSLRLFLLFIMGIFLVSCAGQQVQMPQKKAPEPPFTPYKFDLKQYEPKVKNFIVLFDASFSMRSTYGKEWKFKLAKEFVSRMNQTLPDLQFTAGLRSVGHHPNVSKKSTVLFYGLTAYTKKGLDEALNAIKWPGGNTPMAAGIDAAKKDLESTNGQTAVIIVSDGDRVLMDKDPLKAAEAMKRQYGENVCIYTVLIGDATTGNEILEKLAQAGKCGFSANLTDLMSSQAMADFVEKVFLVKRPMMKAEPTPKPAPKPAPSPMDSDGDGVYDDKDRCPGTPKGAEVDERGCWVIRDVKFDFDKYNIKEEYYPRLNKVVEVLKNNPTVKIDIEGHTDSIGSAEYNQSLSERRAQAVKNYLINKGIAADRFKATGYGLTRPIDSNDTKEGRAKNRRVELTPME
jgi:OOP family OmpA-OmpF porin